jgi:hypothetical protein
MACTAQLVATSDSSGKETFAGTPKDQGGVSVVSSRPVLVS